MVTPAIRVVNPDAPAHRQQAVLVATKEAQSFREDRLAFPKPPLELLNQDTALAHAKKLLLAEGITAPLTLMK